MSEIDPTISCDRCNAACCRLEVMLIDDAPIPPELIATDRHGSQSMRREADGWCVAVDRRSMSCTIYADRPGICRDFPLGGSDCQAARAQAADTAG